MDYFDENNEVVDLEKKIFEEKYQKQMKYAKKTFFWLGLSFLIVGLIVILILLFIEDDIAFVGIPFAAIGLIFLILGIALPEKINYEKFKKRIDKGGYVNIYDLNARIAVLEEKNKILESKIKNLEDEIRKLK